MEIKYKNALIIGDIHFGVKNFNIDILNTQLKYFNEVVIPIVNQYNIDCIIQLGDLFDNRKIIDINFLYELSVGFKGVLEKIPDVKWLNIVGNHDTYFKNTNKINSVSLLKKIISLDNFIVVNELTEVNINGVKTALVPWITDDNEDMLKKISKYKVCFGHFEINDFIMTPGVKCSKGIDKAVFKKTHIISGHFHTPSTDSNIDFVGTPYQINWNDSGNVNFVTVYDGVTFHKIENTYSTKFIKIIYDSRKGKPYNIENVNLHLEDLVKLINTNNVYKVIIEYNEDKSYEELAYYMKQSGCSYEIINNTIFNELNILNKNDNDDRKYSAVELLVKKIEEVKPELTTLMLEILNDIKNVESN